MFAASGLAGQGPGAARPRSGAGGVLEVTAREPDNLAAGNGWPFWRPAARRDLAWDRTGLQALALIGL
jgi:hypothetical protein